MKLFIKDHLSFVLLYVINFIFILLIILLSGEYLSSQLIIYMFFLSLFILFIFLTIRYYKKVTVYKTLSIPSSNLRSMKKRLQGTDLFTDSFIKHENQNYNQFLSEIENYKNKNSEWRTYIVQWVHQMKSTISSMRLALQNREYNEENIQLLVELDQIDKQLNNILNLARLESVDRDLKIEPINLSESINRIINQNKRLFIQNKIFPKIQIENTTSTVLSDKKWLDFIIDQLVHNAIKFSNPTDQIIFNIKQIDNKCCLEISDTGIGIIKEDIHRIFDLYFTGKNGRINNDSSGIGLYLVKQILEQLGHNIKVESEESKGTKFTIYFD